MSTIKAVQGGDGFARDGQSASQLGRWSGGGGGGQGQQQSQSEGTAQQPALEEAEEVQARAAENDRMQASWGDFAVEKKPVASTGRVSIAHRVKKLLMWFIET